jgi:hypothetical protein
MEEYMSDISNVSSDDAMSEVGDDTMSEVRDDVMSEVRDDAMSEVGDDVMSEVRDDAMSEVGDDKELYSNNDTESAVSDTPNILEIEVLGGPEWHILRDYIEPQPNDLSYGALIWSIHYNALTKKSFKQWHRFFFHGNRMKTTDPEFLTNAYKLKSALWYASDSNYHLYHNTYTWSALRLMSNLQMFKRPYFIE